MNSEKEEKKSENKEGAEEDFISRKAKEGLAIDTSPHDCQLYMEILGDCYR